MENTIKLDFESRIMARTTLMSSIIESEISQESKDEIVKILRKEISDLVQKDIESIMIGFEELK